jgi:predicted transcriptional regulator
MTYKDVLLAMLQNHGTMNTMKLSQITGLNRNQCHNNLRSLLNDGLVDCYREAKNVYWTYQGDELKIKQTWSGFVPPKVKHTHPLMTAWF